MKYGLLGFICNTHYYVHSSYVTELCAIGLNNVFSLFGDVTLMCDVLWEITVWTEMVTMHISPKNAIARNAA